MFFFLCIIPLHDLLACIISVAVIGPHAGCSINPRDAGWPWSLAWLQGQGRAWCLRGHTTILLGGRRLHGSRVPAVVRSFSQLKERAEWRWGQWATSLTHKVNGTDTQVLHAEWLRLKGGKWSKGWGHGAEFCRAGGRTMPHTCHLTQAWGQDTHLPFCTLLPSPSCVLAFAIGCFLLQMLWGGQAVKLCVRAFQHSEYRGYSVCLKISVKISDYCLF